MRSSSLHIFESGSAQRPTVQVTVDEWCWMNAVDHSSHPSSNNAFWQGVQGFTLGSKTKKIMKLSKPIGRELKTGHIGFSPML